MPCNSAAHLRHLYTVLEGRSHDFRKGFVVAWLRRFSKHCGFAERPLLGLVFNVRKSELRAASAAASCVAFRHVRLRSFAARRVSPVAWKDGKLLSNLCQLQATDLHSACRLSDTFSNLKHSSNTQFPLENNMKAIPKSPSSRCVPFPGTYCRYLRDPTPVDPETRTGGSAASAVRWCPGRYF